MAQNFISNPTSGSTLSYDLNDPGPTINCVGYLNLNGILYQQPTFWSVAQVGKNSTLISASNSAFMLSDDTISGGLPVSTNFTILNVTSNLDGATITCYNFGINGNTASFVLKIHRKFVYKI